MTRRGTELAISVRDTDTVEAGAISGRGVNNRDLRAGAVGLHQSFLHRRQVRGILHDVGHAGGTVPGKQVPAAGLRLDVQLQERDVNVNEIGIVSQNGAEQRELIEGWWIVLVEHQVAGLRAGPILKLVERIKDICSANDMAEHDKKVVCVIRVEEGVVGEVKKPL